ncbi:MAG: ThiF family adenylyltransferase [Kofleriaceae bacterium]
MTVRATLVGAGGLGGPLAYALGAAGIELTIVDRDRVELSNLHRQIQFGDDDLGANKAERLASHVASRGGQARGYALHWTAEDADELGGDADIIIDASDDPITKFAVADWAVANGRLYVIAAAIRYGGNVMVGAPGAACYRCLFEAPVEALSCGTAGVLGPVVGAIGGLAGGLAIGLVRGDRTHAGSLFALADLRSSVEPRIVRFAPRRGCPACANALVSPFEPPPVVVAEVR